MHRTEWSRTFVRIKRVTAANRFGNLRLVQAPQLQRMIHAARHNPIAGHIEIGAQHLVSMSLDAAKNGNAHVRLNVPQSQRIIFAGRQQNERLFRMEYQLVYGLPVANVMLWTCHCGRIQNANDATKTGNGQNRLTRFWIGRPAAGVENLFWLMRRKKCYRIKIQVSLFTYIRIHVALNHFEATIG